MLIGFNLGCVHKILRKENIPITIHNFITWWRLHSKEIGYFNAIELNIYPEEEKDFQITYNNYEWLNSLRHISYHLIQYTEDTERVIQQLPYINYFVIHEDRKNKINSKFIHKYGHKLLIENVEGTSPNYYNGACLDIAHAQSIFLNAPDRLFNNRKLQIKEIHLSCFDKEKKHVPFFLYPHLFPEFNIKEYPIILEANFENIEEIKKELQFVKEKVYDK